MVGEFTTDGTLQGKIFLISMTKKFLCDFIIEAKDDGIRFPYFVIGVISFIIFVKPYGVILHSIVRIKNHQLP